MAVFWHESTLVHLTSLEVAALCVQIFSPLHEEEWNSPP